MELSPYLMPNHDMWYLHKKIKGHFIHSKQEPEREIVTANKKDTPNLGNNKIYGDIHPLEQRKVEINSGLNYQTQNKSQNNL